jgi:hypothetical protein
MRAREEIRRGRMVGPMDLKAESEYGVFVVTIVAFFFCFILVSGTEDEILDDREAQNWRGSSVR